MNAEGPASDGKPAHERLESWKEIAAYLGRSVTTVQRWEQEERLPIHRHQHAIRGSVFAFKGEVDEWRHKRTHASTVMSADTAAEAEAVTQRPTPADPLCDADTPRPRLRLLWIAGAAAGVLALFVWIPMLSIGSIPRAPRTLSASSPRPGTIVLDWTDDSTDETRFEVRRFDTVAGTFAANVTHAEFHGLDAGTSYHWDIRSCNAAGCSPWHGVVGETPNGSATPVSKALRAATDIAFTSYRVSGRLQIWLMTETGAGPVRITNSMANEMSPAWSPDRSRIAFVSDRTGYLEIYVMNADGSNQVNLTKHDPANDSAPAWSPDGRRIAFASTRSRDTDVWVMNADGSNPVNLTNSDGDDTHPAWSRDGTRIAFTSNRLGAYDIYVMNADGSRQTRLTFAEGDDMLPSWSPDDSRICFTARQGGNHEIFVMNADGSRPTNLSHHSAYDDEATWSPDGRRIAFTTDRNGDSEIYAVSPDGSHLVNLTTIRGVDTHPDWGFPSPFARSAAAAGARLLAPLTGRR